MSSARGSTIVLAIGTRPELIKLGPVARALAARGVVFEIAMTGQHRGLEAPPGARRVWRGEDTGLAAMAELVAEAARTPGVGALVCQGDTRSAWAAALGAGRTGCPVAHVEAGLRSGQLAHPYPEELYRIAIARLARWHFAPDDAARAHLEAEGVDPARVFVVGNTIVDAALAALEKAPTTEERPTVLVTAHRAEGLRELPAIAHALGELAAAHPGVRFVWPRHPTNPAARAAAEEAARRGSPIEVVAPMDHASFLRTLRSALFVMTDSGGVQEEAGALGVPAIIMRRATDRPASVEAGAAVLAGHDPVAIARAAAHWLEDRGALARARPARALFGDGRAAERIVEALLGEPIAPLSHAVQRPISPLVQGARSSSGALWRDERVA